MDGTQIEGEGLTTGEEVEIEVEVETEDMAEEVMVEIGMVIAVVIGVEAEARLEDEVEHLQGEDLEVHQVGGMTTTDEMITDEEMIMIDETDDIRKCLIQKTCSKILLQYYSATDF